MDKKSYSGPERRKSFRITYPKGKRARLETDENTFEIADISEMGLRFYYNEGELPENTIKGSICFLCDKRMKIEGLIVRIAPAFVYMNVIRPIPKSLLEEEASFLS